MRTPDDGLPRLTERQKQILALTANGMRSQRVAAECCIARGTVQESLLETRKRLQAKTTSHAIVLAIAQEILILTHDGRVVVPHPYRIAA
jgi:DNA-binding CsgD family transcriptional regulator